MSIDWSLPDVLDEGSWMEKKGWLQQNIKAFETVVQIQHLQ